MTEFMPSQTFDTTGFPSRLDLVIPLDFDRLKKDVHPLDVKYAVVEFRDKIRAMLSVPQQEDFPDRGEDKDSPATVTQYFQRLSALDFALIEAIKAYFANY